jgi:hypothetical protein
MDLGGFRGKNPLFPSGKWKNNSFLLKQDVLDGSTYDRAANSAMDIKNKTGTNVDGNYWIKFSNGVAYQIYCLMSSGGGGWMNVNRSFGPYSAAIFDAYTGSGSRVMVDGGDFHDSTVRFVGPYSNHNQSAECGNCSGSNCPSRIQVDGNLLTEKNITEMRMQGRVSQVGQQACPYFATPSVSTNVAGTTYTACGGTYSMGFVDVYGPRTNNYIAYAYIACGSPASLTARIEGLYVR